MGNFNRGGGFGGKRSFGNDRGGFRGGERSERPAMHQAICAECGKECSVPFKPTGNKPVFCSNCFGKKEGNGGGRFERRDSRPSFMDKQMFKAECDKCHQECEVPFKPSGDKPVFCNDCFSKTDKGGTRSGTASSDQYKKQLDAINDKLNDILKILAPNTNFDKVVKEDKPKVKAVKEIKIKKTIVKVKPAVTKKVTKKVAAKKKK